MPIANAPRPEPDSLAFRFPHAPLPPLRQWMNSHEIEQCARRFAASSAGGGLRARGILKYGGARCFDMFSLLRQCSPLRPRALFQTMPLRAAAVAAVAEGAPAGFTAAACAPVAFTVALFTPGVSVAVATASLAELGRRIRSRGVPAIQIVR